MSFFGEYAAAGSQSTRNLGSIFNDVPKDRVAVVDLSGDRRRSFDYRSLDHMCDGVARGLQRAGLKAGDRLAVLALNRVEYIAVTFGALRLGVVPVLVNIKLAEETVRYILQDAGAKLAFAEKPFKHLVRGMQVIDLEDDFESFLDKGEFDTGPAAADQLSMLLYTSGTTGKPKGVLLHHGGQRWAAAALSDSRRIRADDRILISAPFYHKNAIVAIKTALLPGACLVVLPRFDARATISAIEQESLTMLTGVPTMMSMILREPALQSVRRSLVRVISMGSSPASDQLLAALKDAFPKSEIHLNYGSTEGGPIMFGWYHPNGLPRPAHSVGVPIPGCEWRLVHGASPDEGELWVRNPGVANGYLNLPDATAARFQDGWFKTGDILRRDGHDWFYFVGRVDDMFVSGGENVFPQEVEALLERHPAVRQAAVVAIPHELKGMVPVAFAVTQAGTDIDEAALKGFTLSNGPAYAHPRRIFFLDSIPLTGTNKIDRDALKRLALQAEKNQ